MIPANALVTPLQAYVKPADAPLVQVVDAIQEIQQLFTIGEQVRAQVTGLLPSGRYAVLVKDQLLDLNLPRNTEEGQHVDMRVLANSPRLTFLLQRQQPETSPDSSNHEAADSSTAVDLSKTARFIGELVANLHEQPDTPAKANVLQAPTALLDADLPADVQKLAAKLEQALTQSGLFYESHLAQWVAGERPLAQLLKEPQANGFGASQPPAEEAAEPSPEHAQRGRAGGQAALSLPSVTSDDDTEAAKAKGRLAESLLALASGPHDVDTLPPAARQLVQQQLQLLDQRSLVWQGLAWPGQPLRWEIEEDDRRQPEDGGATARIWRTRLQLELPRLGSLEVIISLLDQSRVEVGFRVGQAGTAERIRSEQSRLQNQLESAGLALQSNQVLVVDESRSG